MFFRRMFSRKDRDKEEDRDSSSSPLHPLSPYYQHHNHHQPQPSSTNITDNGCRPLSIVQKSPMKRRASSSAANLSVIQLTPLWEHIIRTRSLPEDLNPVAMFEEFVERLQDPEWQVRQHALRVLIDVLIVMGQKADSFFAPVIPHLVENLGHQAPTVRKGSLDALRVYISETAMPESVLLEVMDIGLNQRITNEPFGGRLTCGVMLSLPALVQSTLHTPKRNYILRSTIELLVSKMTQVTHQEVTLKVLQKIRDLIGPHDFSEYMSHGAYKEFELLCDVYGLTDADNLDNGRPRSSWHPINSFEQDDGDSSSNQAETYNWQSVKDDDTFKDFGCSPNEKIIMETEIKINDDTLTMRILERDDELLEDGNCQAIPLSDDEDITGTLENSGIIHVLSDSELEDINNNVNDDDDDTATPRTPKRVTFGGEIVKMRTPDSDTTVQSDVDNSNSANSKPKFENMNFLTVDIPNDNTKPIVKETIVEVSAAKNVTQSRSATSPATHSAANNSISMKSTKERTPSPPVARNVERKVPLTPPSSPKKPSSSPTLPTLPSKEPSPAEVRVKSASASPFRRISISPVDSIISPRTSHKEIEVLHNLQRSPCISPRQSSSRSRDDEKEQSSERNVAKAEELASVPQAAKSWEELGIVDDNVLKDLKSGDWRHRLKAISSIEDALKSSDNLAKIQPCLDSFLRMLLSSERNPEVIEDKRRILMNLISRLPLDNLENRSTQIITGLCRQGGAGSNRVCKSLMQRLPPSFIVLKLLSDDFLHARSSRFRENALQMVMYALMTFPSTCFDTATCINRTIYAALDKKRRVRQASLDVLAVLGQVTSPRAVLDSLQAITTNRDEGNELLAAVQARLARKQLPTVGPEGSIEYALRVPSPHSGDIRPENSLGADVEWIISGVGSVSPTSLRRRSQRFIHSSKPLTVPQDRNGERRIIPPHEILALGVGVQAIDDFINTSSSSSFQGNSDDTDDSRTSYQYSLATSNAFQYKPLNGSVLAGGDIFGIHGKRIASRCGTDSTSDRRSSSDGSSGTQTNKLPVTSRFPAMDVVGGGSAGGTFIERQTSYRNPYDQFNLPHYGINATYPKGHARKMLNGLNGHHASNGNYARGAFNESKFNDATPQRPTSSHHHHHVVYEPAAMNGPAFVGQRRFGNLDKMTVQSNKLQHSQEHHSRHQNDLETLSTKGSTGANSNGHINGNDDDDKIFTKSAFSQDRSLHQQQSLDELEETQSFKQIDSVSLSSNKRKDTPNDTASTKSMGKGSQESIALPNSIEDDQKSLDASNKSIASEVIASRPISVQSKHDSIQSKPQSAVQSTSVMNESSRPESVSVNSESAQSEGHIDASLRARSATSLDLLGSKDALSVKSEKIGNSSPEKIKLNDEVDAGRKQSTNNELLVEAGRFVQENVANIQGNFEKGSAEALETKSLSASELDSTLNIAHSVSQEYLAAKSAASSARQTPTAETVNIADVDEIDEVDKQQSNDAFEMLKNTHDYKSTPSSPPLDAKTPTSPLRESIFTPTKELRAETPPGFQTSEETTTPKRGSSNPTTPKPQSTTPLTPTPAQDIFESPLPIRSTSIPSLLQEFSDSPVPPKSASKRTPFSSRHSSMAKSSDSIFEASLKVDPDTKSTASTASSEYPPSQVTCYDEPLHPKSLVSTAKSINLPVVRKSKTTFFGRNRRVSPVKQSIKLTQAEVFPQTLLKFEKPRNALNLALMDLDSTEWETVIVGLRSLVRMMRHHPDTLDPQIHVICIQLGKAVRNLRSQVSRAACQAATELYTVRTKLLEQECDDLAGNLLHRTADTNQFLRADAMRALEAMCDNLSPQKVIHILNSKGLSHQNAAVRTSTAKLLNRLVDRIGYDRVFTLGREHRDRLLIMAANLLMEGSLETRSYTKKLFHTLAENPTCGRILKEVVPNRTYRNIEKTLKSIF